MPSAPPIPPGSTPPPSRRAARASLAVLPAAGPAAGQGAWTRSFPSLPPRPRDRARPFGDRRVFHGENGPANVPFLGGVRCAALPFVRLGVRILDGSGATEYAIPVTPQMASTYRWYQFWYRDPFHTDGTGVGLSSALRVVFCP